MRIRSAKKKTTMEATTTAAAASSSRKKKRAPRGANLGVPEPFRIKVVNILEEFLLSNEEMYTFDASLKSQERAAVHMLSKRMGMRSKSSGRGARRRLSVFKKKKQVDASKRKENLSSFAFSQDSRLVLQDLFTQYPPVVGEGGECIGEPCNRKTKIGRVKSETIFSKSPLSDSEIRKRVDSFAARMEKSPKLRQITQDRTKLPISSFKDTITSAIESNQVVLISGETGCGKTTQVPQFLLDYMWTRGETCKIVCTQPRRISATSVAERISAERGEDVGDTVGYKIRLESRGGPHSSIVFCTNGILLRVLVARGNEASGGKSSRKMEKDELANITHIIVDEIHERDRYSDFMLAIIRDMLPLYPHLRLVLMSATIDAERFSVYFGSCPTIRVPGFTYPVKSFYLEDVLSTINSTQIDHEGGSVSSSVDVGTTLTEEYVAALDEAIDMALLNDEFDTLLDLLSSGGGSEVFNYQHSSTGVTPLMVFAGKGRVGDVCMLLSFGADCSLLANDGTSAINWAERENQGEVVEIIRQHMDDTGKKQQLVDKYMSEIDPELIDTVLIEQLLKSICTDSKDGAVLIFLPGWDDINRTRERLQASSFFKDPSKFVILALHSMVPAVEQKKVFKRPPSGCRKIILSTNIAETAVTIDDVVYVIDSGRMKEKSYDPYNNVSTLQSSWISKASAKQREGRAGRCQPGICYHLYSELRAASLPDFQVPEIKRMPVEELCLQVKLVDPNCKIEDFLNKTLDPPVYETIRNAIMVLQDIGALSPDEKLTELGEKLGSLPVHPLTSKMLLIAILLNCLDPALTLACASDYRDPFTLPMRPNDKKKAADARCELASLYMGRGDQLAVIAAFDCWRIAKEKGQEAKFCSQYFVSSTTMAMISRMRKQLQSELHRNGFIPVDESRCSSNARDPGILHAVLVAGLYPMVGRLLPPLKGGKKAIIETSGGDKVRLHPHSTNFKLSFKKFETQPLVIYDEITRGDGGLHIRNCCVVGALPLLLLATEIIVAPASENDDEDEDNEGSDYDDSNDEDIDEDKMETNESGSRRQGKIMSSPDNTVKVFVDRWLPFESIALDVAQIYCLRERLSAAISFKVKHPGKALPGILEASIYSIVCILSYDGMSGVPLQSEPVDSLPTEVATETDQSDPGKKREMTQSSDNYLKSLMYHDKRPHSTFCNQGFSQASAVVGTNPHQKHGAAFSGPPKGKYSKRPQGNGK